jgi:hypothetical protein
MKGSQAPRESRNFSSHVSRGPLPKIVYQPPMNRLTVESSGLNPCCRWNPSQGLASSFSAKAKLYASGLPCEPMYVSPGTDPP